MNKEYILKLLKKSLNQEGNLDIKDFDRFFGSLYDSDKDEIEVLLNENSIELIYDPEVENVYFSKNMKPLPTIKNVELTNEQLCVLYQQGNTDALTLLVVKNQRLIYSRALKFNKIYNHKLDIDDLYQSGFIGLMVAANRFDNTLGFKFTTYAINWIDQKISRDIIDHGFTVRVPVHLFEKINKIETIRRRNNTLEECEIRELIKTELNYDDEEINFLQVVSHNVMSPVALSAPVGEEGDSYLGDFIEDNTTPTIEDEIELLFLREEINKSLQDLRDREQEVIILRFGLNGNKAHTLEEVGQKYEVTRERIRQIEAKALRKLKFNRKMRHLRGYLINE